MKTKLNLMALGLFTILAMGIIQDVQAQTRARSGDRDEVICVIPKLSKDKVPFPIADFANTIYELAPGATYVLTGTIVNIKNKPYFQIDFNSQPWLASAARVQYPYLPLNSSDLTMAPKYNGQLVQMAVVARQDRATLGETDGVDSMTLDLITGPAYLMNNRQ
jgi:hypothetical protein